MHHIQKWKQKKMKRRMLIQMRSLCSSLNKYNTSNKKIQRCTDKWRRCKLWSTISRFRQTSQYLTEVSNRLRNDHSRKKGGRASLKTTQRHHLQQARNERRVGAVISQSHRAQLKCYHHPLKKKIKMTTNRRSQRLVPSDSALTQIMIVVKGVWCADILPRAAVLSHMSGYKTVIRGREKATQALITKNDTPTILRNKAIKRARLIRIGC